MISPITISDAVTRYRKAINELIDRTDATVEFPIGGVVDFPGLGTTRPAGPGTWVEYTGQTIARTDFVELFAAWGVAASTLVLDRRGRVTIGAGTATATTSARAVGQTGGEESHALTVAELPSHRARLSQSVVTVTNQGPAYIVNDQAGAARYAGVSGGQLDSDLVGEDRGHNTMQPFLVTRYFVRAR